MPEDMGWKEPVIPASTGTGPATGGPTHRADDDAATTQGSGGYVNFAQDVFSESNKFARYKAPKKKAEILGLSGTPSLRYAWTKFDGSTHGTTGLTLTEDYTTHVDRADITIYNGLGYNIFLTGIQLDAKRIMKYSDALINDKLKRDNDIRNNGEKILEVNNDAIILGTQVDKIADYWYKYHQVAKHIYTVTIPGFAPWYEPGEWYSFALGSADHNEYISATVECYSVDCEKKAGGIGSTTAKFREVQEDWSKTTFYAARAIAGGGPKRRAQRSQNVVVASTGYFGPYDYLCDGTADDVQIQAAIDYLATNFGGGTVELMRGTFTISQAIEIKSNIQLSGQGNATVIQSANTAAFTMIQSIGTSGTHNINIMLNNIYIYANHSSASSSFNAINFDYTDNAIITNVSFDLDSQIAGIIIQHSTSITINSCYITGAKGYGMFFTATSNILKTSNCTVNYSALNDGNGIGSNATDCVFSNCIVHDIVGNSTSGFGIVFAGNRNTVNGCSVYNITADGAGNGYGISAVGSSDNVMSGNVVNACDYGITISGGGSNDNIVTGNRATGCAVSNYSDSGTGTINSGNSFV